MTQICNRNLDASIETSNFDDRNNNDDDNHNNHNNGDPLTPTNPFDFIPFAPTTTATAIATNSNVSPDALQCNQQLEPTTTTCTIHALILVAMQLDCELKSTPTKQKPNHQMERTLKSLVYESNLNSFNEQTNKFAQSIKSILSNMVINLRATSSSASSSSPSSASHSATSSASSTRRPTPNTQTVSASPKPPTPTNICNPNDNDDDPKHNDNDDDDHELESLDWPESFIHLLNSLLLKQQQRQQLDRRLLVADEKSEPIDDATEPENDANAARITCESPSVSSLAIDDRDFELTILQLDDNQLDTQNNNENSSTDKNDDPNTDQNSIWLMDFALPVAQIPHCVDIPPETNSPIDDNNNNICNDDDVKNLSLDQTERNIMNLMKFLTQKCVSTQNLSPTRRLRNPRRHRSKTLPFRFEYVTSIDLNQLKSPLELKKLASPQPNLHSTCTESIIHVQDFDEEESDLGLGARNSNGGQSSPLSPMQAADSKQLESQSAASKRDEQNSSSVAAGQEPAKEDGKYSMLQFALYNFREAIDKYSLESRASKAPQSAGDTSTLRGSLKLIESLRNGSLLSSNSSNATGNNTNTLGSSKGEKKSRLAAAAQLNLPGMKASDWTWRELAEMVKFTRTPLRHSLLKLPSEDLNRRAVDSFLAIMQYMGDVDAANLSSAASSGKHHHQQVPQNEVDCVYLILMNCHNYPLLRDEIYCQLIKQTTNNRSVATHSDSCLRGWRLFSMVAAYFDCSDMFRPYLLKYLETAAYDKRRAYCSVALLCLQNLRKTIKFGGRKNVPSIEEIAATSAGRNSKRQIYRLPGGTERVINTKSTTVVDDIIHEICVNMLDVGDSDEMLEFSLYCIADGDLYTMPLNRDEYILDITTELIKNHQQYFLIFCRSIWYYPLRLDSKLYIEVIFNQIAPDYLEGLFLVLPSLARHQRAHQRGQQVAASTTTASSPTSNRPLRLKAKLVKEVAKIAALLHRASGTDHMPHKDEIKYLLPKPIVSAMRQQQRALAGANSENLSDLTAPETSADFDDLSTSDAHDEVTSNGSSREQQVASAADSVVTTPQKWVELVQGNWREMSAFDTLDAKAQFLNIVRHWPLFGSSFFAIKLFQRDLIQPLDFILALNKLGIQMLDTTTHETRHRYPFNEVISTRKVRSEDGALFLDLKCGNLMKRTIIRIQTDQAHEISRLIRQYIEIELIQQKQQQQHNH